MGICVSGDWLVVTFDAPTTSTGGIRLYRLPDLTPIQDLNYSAVLYPRCSSDGQVYVPAWDMVTELEITAQGNLTVLRNITTGEWDWITAVGLGPQTGQLCVGAISSLDQLGVPVVCIINLASGNITTTLTPSDHMVRMPLTVSALSTGQILMTSFAWFGDLYIVSVLYQTIAHPPLTLSNGTRGAFVSVANRENFVVIRSGFQNGIAVLDAQGNVIHAVEYDYVYTASDLAVWQDSMLVINGFGGLLWLSPD